MTDHEAIDLELHKRRLENGNWVTYGTNADIKEFIVAVEALRERVARLTGCDSLDCPECGQASNTERAGCKVCGATFSLKSFNEYIKEGSAHEIELAEALELLCDEMGGSLPDEPQEFDSSNIWIAFGKAQTTLAARPAYALERARARDEVVRLARLILTDGNAIGDMKNALAKLAALNPGERGT